MAHGTDRDDLDAVVIHVTQFADVLDAGDAYRSGWPVDLLLDRATREVGRRAIDFAAGLAYSNDGDLEKVSDLHFRLTPGHRGPGDGDADREPRRPSPDPQSGVVALPTPEGEDEVQTLLPAWPGPTPGRIGATEAAPSAR